MSSSKLDSEYKSDLHVLGTHLCTQCLNPIWWVLYQTHIYKWKVVLSTRHPNKPTDKQWSAFSCPLNSPSCLSWGSEAVCQPPWACSTDSSKSGSEAARGNCLLTSPSQGCWFIAAETQGVPPSLHPWRRKVSVTSLSCVTAPFLLRAQYPTQGLVGGCPEWVPGELGLHSAWAWPGCWGCWVEVAGSRRHLLCLIWKESPYSPTA